MLFLAMPCRRGSRDELVCVVKCRLSSILFGGRRSPAFEMLRKEVLRAHEMAKLGTFFFKAFCLSEKEVPPICHSTSIACLQQVTTRSTTGAKGKSALEREIFQGLPRQSGSRSMPKATVPESMTDCLLTNATTHFKSRCMRLCGLLGVDRNRTANCVDNAFRGMWDLVDEVAREHDHSFGPSKRIRPLRPEEEALRVRCSHLQAVYRVTDGMNRQKEEKQKEEAVSEFCLAPLRTSCIPKHVKIHTEILAQILVPHKEAVLARKNAPTRNHYNDWVWNRCWPGRRWIAS